MAYDQGLAHRIREYLSDAPEFTEKKMFGGLAFLDRGNMCVGIIGETLMARVGKVQYQQLLSHPHAKPMDFTSRPMTGFLTITPEGITEDPDLHAWIDRCRAFTATLPQK